MLRIAARSFVEAGAWSHRSLQSLIVPVTQAPVQSQWPRLFAKQAGEGGESAGSGLGNSSGSSGDEAAGPAAESQSPEAGSSSMDVAELQELLGKAQEEAAGLKDRLQRNHAAMQNLIDRQKREKETLQTYAVQKFAETLLEVADNLESAARAVPTTVLQEGADVSPDTALKYLRSLLEGVQATERVLLKTMGTQGVQRIETAQGDDFDPNTMEAMSTVPSPGGDAKPHTIANVWQSGYKIHDRVLRAAKVIVYQE